MDVNGWIVTKEERKAKRRARDNNRYNNDPEYREKVLRWQREARKKNPEKFREKDKERAKNPKRQASTKKRSLEYYKKHREELKSKQKELRANHPEIAYAWFSRSENKERRKKYNREYSEKNRGKRRATHAKRRALKKQTLINKKGVAEFYKFIVDGDQVFCYYCQQPVPKGKRHVDHVIPLCLKGPHELGNLASSCKKCNQWKNHRRIKDWKRPGQQIFDF